MEYTLRFFFSSECSLFHNSNVFGSCIIHILYTGVLKFKKSNSGAKRLSVRESEKKREQGHSHLALHHEEVTYFILTDCTCFILA